MTTKTFGCAGNTIRLRSGHYLDLADPKTDQFVLTDIIGALSKICRFGGQIDRFYSVAEHSVHCARIARREHKDADTQIALLMHDAAEAFCGDVVKPLKIMLDRYAEIEQRIASVIAEKYHIDFDREDWYVKDVDEAMLIAERKALFCADNVSWVGEDSVRKIEVPFEYWSPPEAERAFLREAAWLGMEKYA